jgi:pimeloyl-ACP methyl ester carboxylesterase
MWVSRREGLMPASEETTNDPAIDRERFERHLARSEFYAYPGPPEDWVVGDTGWPGRVRVSRLHFPSPLPSGIPSNDTVRARLFLRPGRTEGPPVVFVHGFGAWRLGFWDTFPRSLAFRGFPTLSVCLPYLCERATRGERPGYAYMSTSAEKALPAYEQAVADIRASLDWLLSQSPLARERGPDSPPPVIIGVSLGALIAVIAAGIEPRFGGLVPMLGGGDLDIIVFKGAYRTPVERELEDAHIQLENRRNARRIYQAYLEEVRSARHPLDVVPAFHFFLFDPLTFASHLRTKPALMLNARYDPLIPRAAARQLWLELGQPPLSWFWGTHWTGGPWKPYTLLAVTRFLRGLKGGGVRVPADSYAEEWMP